MSKILAKNKKALFDYEIIKKYEAWIILKWHEVKSIKYLGCNLKWSHIVSSEKSLFIVNIHIPVWKTMKNKKENREKIEILLEKKEIFYIKNKIKDKWLTLVPIDLHLKWSIIKTNIALVKWKRKYEKKNLLKERSIQKDAKIEIKKIYN